VLVLCPAPGSMPGTWQALNNYSLNQRVNWQVKL
jgi:hypothetical protein